MLPKSVNYNTIWNDPAHYAETKLVVGADTYDESVIMSCTRTQTLFADYFNIGNTVMNQIQFSLTGVTASQLPRLSRVELWTRLWVGDGSDSTDWLPMGVYYTGKPDYDTEAQLLTVTAYDEMYKTGVVPFESGSTVTAWDYPTLRQVAEHIVEGTVGEGWVHTWQSSQNPIVQGSINSLGEDTTDTSPNYPKRVRTSGYISVQPSTEYKCNSNLMVGIYEYDADQVYIGNNGWQSTPYTFTTGATTYFIRVALKTVDDDDITPADVTSFEVITWGDVIDSNFAGIGLELEDATQVLDTITMPSIPYNYTVREILSDIAVACCGNWTTAFQDDSGTQKAVLRLVKNADWTSPTLIDLGRNVTAFEKGDDIAPVTDVYVYYGYDSNGVSLYGHAQATPNDGREFECEVKTITDGTQANLIASEILTGLGGTFYHPYTATGAELDPATEIGDTVTVNSVTSIVGTLVCDFNRGMWADISAEGLEPVDDFDYLSGSARQADRTERSAEVNSARIAVNADAITAEVERATGAEDDLNTNLRSTITQTAKDVTITLQNYAQDQVNNHAVEQQTYIRYSADGLELGEAGTNAKAILTNEALKFYDPSDDVKAYIGLDELYNPQVNPINQGGISSAGANYNATNRLRTNGYIAVNPSTQYRISFLFDGAVFVRAYSSNTSASYLQNDGSGESPLVFTTSANTNYIRLHFVPSSGNDVTPADLTELSITATSGDYKFFVINGHIVRQLELGDHWLLVASGSDNDNRLTFKWRA